MKTERQFAQIVRAVNEAAWAIMPGTLEAMLELLAMHAAGESPSREVVAAATQGREPVSQRQARGVQIIPIAGPIFPRANMMTEMSGATSLSSVREEFAAAVEDDRVSSILLELDSPGGMADLVPEFAAEIFAARDVKPVVAVANTLAASAAYWLGSAASEFYVTPSGMTGSIGVFATHVDVSKQQDQEGIKTTLVSAGKYKTEGNPYEPLSDSARAAMQTRVDSFYDLFTADVAKFRGTSQEAVAAGYGEGRVLDAKASVRAGLVDGIQTFDSTLGAMLAGGSKGDVITAQDLPPALTAVAGDFLIANALAANGLPPSTVGTFTSFSTHRSGSAGATFVEEAEQARRAVSSLVTRMQGLAELAAGRLTTAKREQIAALHTELLELGTSLGQALEQTAPGNPDADAAAAEAEAWCAIIGQEA